MEKENTKINSQRFTMSKANRKHYRATVNKGSEK